MKSILSFPTVLLLLVSLGGGFAMAADYPSEVTAAKAQIKSKALVSTIDFLASKFCRGRKTGEPGMDVAIKFITTLLSGANVTPAGEYGGYLQTVPLHKLTLGANVALDIEEHIGGSNIKLAAKLQHDFAPISLSAEKEVQSEVVFAGYGITAPEYKYDDYQGLNVSGKIVLLLRHEPKEKEEGELFEGARMSPHATLLSKIRNAQKHGACGVLVVNDPLNHEDEPGQGINVGGTYWPEFYLEQQKKDEDFKYMNTWDQIKITGDDFGITIPAAAISSKLAASLLGADRSLLQLQKEIDASLKPKGFALNGKKVSLAIHFKRETIEATNILAKVEGSDPILKDEFVVIGAHYDHLGKNNRGQIFGGADDNASGTAAVIEIAKAFQNMGLRPKRTLIFALFCGEEMGLYGSRYYTEHPLYPLDKTVAMINLDMISRNALDQLNALGKYQYPKLFSMMMEINSKSSNFDIDPSIEGALAGSDHFPFMRHDVPSLFLISGMHDQYHRPEDTVDRVIPDKIAKVAHLAFLTMWQVAELPTGSKLK
jgi:hypothetical protein